MATSVSVDNPIKIQPGDRDWKVFEKDVANLTARMDSGTETVEHDAKLVGELSDVPRQIDVLVQGLLNGERIRIAIECKRHSTAVDVTHIDKFVGMLLDLPVDSGVFYAFGPVTPGARRRAANARHPKVSMKELAGEALLPPWSDSLEEISPWGTCSAPNCRAGEI
ncbi:restriction endonuclease [Microbacterium aurum]|uniref:restriction endonuclease n=1 Tax=Microbacterium aurum TaxID=36805 RepID=UPI001EF53F3D|nr:restriction endonuclease [Microbacterium aurum]MCG7415851.1 restriction endonuclease [Microbacterium aurum]